MTTVRIAHVHKHAGRIGHLVVLADEAGHRAVPIWVWGDQGIPQLSDLMDLASLPAGQILTAGVPQELTTRLLTAARARVTGVDIDLTTPDAEELNQEVTVARIGLTGPAGTRQVTAALGLALALAAAAGAPVRLADAVLDRLAVPVPGDDPLTPFLGHVPPTVPALSLDHPGPLPHELTDRLLHATGARVAAVDIDELGPEVTAARIELATAAGTEHVTASLTDGLIMAVTTAAPVRVADAVMDRLAVPAGAGQGGPVPEQTARALPPSPHRPRYEPRNMAFADGLDYWWLSGTFVQNAIASRWQDYSSTADDGIARLAAAVPQPEGFALLAQTIYADDYRGAEIVFRGQVRVPPGADLAGLFLRIRNPEDHGLPLTEAAALADPTNHIVTVEEGGD